MAQGVQHGAGTGPRRGDQIGPARRGSAPAVAALAARYREETGLAAAVLGGSSPGALPFGVVRLRQAPR